METELSQNAKDVIALVRELGILNETAIRSLEQLFVHRVNNDLVASLVTGKEALLVGTLYKVICQSHSDETRGYALRFLADLSQECPSLIDELSRPEAFRICDDDPAAHLMDIARESKLIGVVNPAICLVAAVLRRSNKGDARAPVVAKFVVHCLAILSQAEFIPEDIEYTIHAVSMFVRRKELRTEFQKAQLVKYIPPILQQLVGGDVSTSVQLLYETLLTAWILTFDYHCMVDLHTNKIIPTVHRVLQRVAKEKCVRMCVLILKNYVSAQRKFLGMSKETDWLDTNIYVLGQINHGKGPNFYSDMIGVGIIKTLWQLSRKKYGDEDVPKDIEEVNQILESNLDVVTSFSEYMGEVMSGVLEWSPVHTSAKFWRENVKNFETNQYEALRELSQLIAHSKSELTVAIACHDVGEIVRYHPSGRLLLQVPQLAGLKEHIMELMSSNIAEVAKEALLAVQKIMVQKWECVAKQKNGISGVREQCVASPGFF